MILGFDINHWKYPVNIQSLVNAGGKFIIGKATDGIYYSQTYINMHLEWKSTCAILGIPYASYHYYLVSKDAKQQADYYYANGLTKAVPMIDLEKTNNLNVYSKTIFTSRLKDHLLAVADKFLAQPIIYTNKDSILQLTTEPSWLADYKLWVASYQTNYVMPTPWIGKVPIMHQFSASYMVGGKSFDANNFLGAEVELNAIFNFVPTPLPTPVIVPGIQLEVVVSALNIRSGPGTSYPVTGSLVAGDKPVELEQLSSGGIIWSRIGWKQWAAKQGAVVYMKYVYPANLLYISLIMN